MALLSALVLALGIAAAGVPSLPAMAAPGGISGTVFHDRDSNGVFDAEGGEAGLAGVEVTAYDAAGAEVGSATTGDDGSYSLSYDTGDDSTDVRLEFATPDGMVPARAGLADSESGTTVQFVSDGDTADVGFHSPGEVVADNPTLTWAEQFSQVPGPTGWIDPATQRSIGSLPYEDRGVQDTNAVTEALMSQTGAIWGLASVGETHVVSSALFKRLVIDGPGGLGAVYLTELGGDPDAEVFVTIPNAGTSPRPADAATNPDGYDWFHDVDAHALVGTIGLGGLAVSPENDALYVVNLNDKNLYMVPITGAEGAPEAGDPVAIGLPLDLPGASQTCSPDNVRPFGVSYLNGSLWVTLTCTGPTAGDLRGFVYELDPSGAVIGGGPALEIPMDEERGFASTVSGDASANWEPWSDDPPVWSPWISQPQPLLSDVDFDINGDMTVGVKDRYGDQSGINAGMPDTGLLLTSGAAAGDVVRACADGAGAFVLESGGVCGDRTGYSTINNQGHGGGEFYNDDYGILHQQTALGAVLQVPGFDEIVTTNYDPGLAVNSQGFRFPSNQDGTYPATGWTRTANPLTTPGAMGKASGLGDLDVLLAEPVEIGNRVWIDTDRDGIQDPGEAPVEGVTVNLACVDGSTGSTTTNAAGEYFFNDENVEDALAASTECTVTFDPAGTSADGLELTTADSGDNDAIDSDAVLDGDSVSITLTTPASGADHTHDVGFIEPELCSVGDYVWRDLNNNGVQDGEPGVANVTATLIDPDTGDPVPDVEPTVTNGDGFYEIVDIPCGDYQIEFSGIPEDTTFTTPGTGDDDTIDSDPIPNPDDPSTGVTETFTVEPSDDDIDNPTIDAGVVEQCSIGDVVWYDLDGNGQQGTDELGVPDVTVTLLDAQGEPVPGIDPQVTGADGEYLFAEIACGDYQVQFSDIPDGYGFTTPDASGIADDEDSDAVPTEDDPTIGVTATYTLGADPQDPADNEDLTVDAGIVQVCTIGDYVWLDTNGDGLQDIDELGVPGVTVTLLDPETGDPVPDIDPQVTGGDGGYSFTVPCGTYVVEFSDIPDGYGFTTPDSGGDDTNDSDPTPLTEDPTVGQTPEVPVGGNDPSDNPDIDAGLVGPSCAVGNYVWFDTNRDGLQDTEESGADGITVTLLDADGNPVPGVDPVTTSGGGWYVFDGLACADYQVSFTDLPEGYTFTTQQAGDQDGVDSDPDVATGITRVVPLGEGQDGSRPVTDDDQLEADFVNPNLDAGIIESCVIGDYVWNDLDGDGTQDDGEPGIPGVTVILIDPETGEPVPGVDPQTTDDEGHYAFEGIQCGTYVVQFSDVPPGASPSDPGEGDDPAEDSNVDPEPVDPGVYETPPVTVGEDPEDPADNVDPTIDAGFYISTCAVGDNVWFDLDGDGLQSDSEYDGPGVPSPAPVVTVTLLDGDGNPVEGVAPVTTDNGWYQFDNLECGEYRVQFSDLPEGWGLTTQQTGDDPQNDSNPDPETGITPPFTLGEGEYLSEVTVEDDPYEAAFNNPSIDAGLVERCAIGDYVWSDLNGDGVQDDGEPGIPGVTVTLIDPETGDPVPGVEPQVTDADGKYTFTVECGTYVVEFSDLPPGAEPSDPGQGDDPAEDSNVDPEPVDPGVYRTPPVTVGEDPEDPADNDDPTVDAGFQLPVCTVGGVVWLDENGDGIQNPDEQGVSGVTVTLLDEFGDPVAGADPVVTAEDGTYSFTVECGTYRVQFDDPKDRPFSPRNQGEDPGQDSDPDPQTGITQPYTVSPDNPVMTTIDAGLTAPPQLGDTGAVSGAGAALLGGLVLALAGSGLLLRRRVG